MSVFGRSKLVVAVLGGGDSPEREISLKSALGVEKALKEAGYKTRFLDPRDELEELQKMDPKTTLVFPILHGPGGEDGVIQKYLEDNGFRFLGSSSEASASAFDKALTKEILVKNNLPTAEYAVVDKTTYFTHELTSKPHVIKITTGGSSIGTVIVEKPGTISREEVMKKVFEFGDTAVVEEFVSGQEISVPVFGNRALPIIEITPPEGGQFDYENKYNGETKEVCPPETLEPKLQEYLKKLAVQVHQAVGCRHLSRVDMIVRSDGSAIVLEINNMPGMTSQSLYPKAANVDGMSFPQLMKKFVKMVK